MPTWELSRKETYGDDEYPAQSLAARITLTLETGTPAVPNAAARKIALRLLREMLVDAQPEDLALLGKEPAEAAAEPAADLPKASSWTKPADLDMRIVKSAHRMVLEVAQRGQSGKAVMASELVGAVGLSAPTVGRLLKEGEPAHDYVRQFVLAQPAGRTKALDLTAAGRLLASRIRAGSVPA